MTTATEFQKLDKQVVDRLVTVRYYPHRTQNTRDGQPEPKVLLGKSQPVRKRVLNILFATAGVAAAFFLFAAAVTAVSPWPWPPPASSPLGIGCGVVGGLIVVFEMLILPRKWYRGKRLGRTRAWMAWHIWMGLLCFPMIVVHSGFGFGGWLTTVTFALFIAVNVSGIWGLIVQQWLPQMLLEDVPGETVATQINRMGDYHADEADRLITALVTVPPEAESATPVISGPLAAELVAFRDDVLLPYLQDGSRSRSPLATPTDAEQRFGRLREAVPDEARKALDRLQELADLRRRWDFQARINFWLHNWLLFHLPLSVAMSSLMILHAIRALKFW